VAQKGHAKVPNDDKRADGYRIGFWVSNQRTKKDKMSSARKARLEVLPGWSWDPLADKWEEGFGYLKEYADREGHCKVSHSHITADGYRLGQWVGSQRTRKNSMSAARKARLEALQGWVWAERAIGEKKHWDEWFQDLKKFTVLEGNCLVPTRHKTPDGYRLGLWVSNQRRSKDDLSLERKARLEALPGWVWRVK
jgi:hypothetical protein